MNVGHSTLLKTVLAAAFVLAGFPARAQIAPDPNVNTSKMGNYQNECAIAKDPTNKMRLFIACNNATGGLFAARSTDLGVTWIYPDPTTKTIANVNPAFGPPACCDPTLAWDTFGNLFVTYIDNGPTKIVTLLSTDGGATFTTLAQFGPASVDQPTVVAEAGAVWIVWNQSNQMVARGAPVTALGAVGAFGSLQTIPGTTGCSFGDLSIAPSGKVVQVCESPAGGSGPASLLVNTKPDGLGPNPFNSAVTATSTNVGGFHFIPPQNTRSIDAEAGLAYDRNPTSPHFGRLYLAYTDEPMFPQTNILLRFSDDDGATWSNPAVAVSDNVPGKSQFLPRIAGNRLSGDIAVCWHDARNSPGNTSMQEFCTIATPSGATPTFMANGQVGAALSDSNGSNPPAAGQADIQFGDYSGLAYFQGRAHPAWADDSNSTGDNPDATSRYDAYTVSVSGGLAANEGDPHLLTVNGVHYDFQSAGEFVALRDYDGLQIQTRQSPVATVTNPGPDPHDGLAMCVSLNTAVAARVGGHRVTYQPNLSGVPDPSGLQLRVDGAVRTLPAAGITLGPNARILPPPTGTGIHVEFPNGTVLNVTSNWWPSQSRWYLNADVYQTPSLEGLLGVVPSGSWLPALPSGLSMGPMPGAMHQRYTDLYQKFADAWRVTPRSSLFDYAPGTSTATFTNKAWPPEKPPCTIPSQPVAKPMDTAKAEALCERITGRYRRRDCVFDVAVTGELGFAKLYATTQATESGGTVTILGADRDPTRPQQGVVFTATVTRLAPGGKGAPAGTVHFVLDGAKDGVSVRLDARGHAVWRTAALKPGRHQIVASYVPSGPNLASRSAPLTHTVVALKR